MTHGPDYLTWLEWTNSVLELLPQDRQRIGLMSTASDGDYVGYIPKLIRQAVLDLQDFIPAYRKQHETIYYPEDFVADGAASVGTLPPQANLKEAWLWNVNRAQRFAVYRLDWSKRFELTEQHDFNQFLNGTDYIVLAEASFEANRILGIMGSDAGRKHIALMAVDRAAHRFYIHPSIMPGWILSIVWEGRKLEWRKGEMVPFGEEEAEAVSARVRAKIAMEVDRDSKRHDDFMRDYTVKRTNLFTARKEAGRLQKS